MPASWPLAGLFFRPLGLDIALNAKEASPTLALCQKCGIPQKCRRCWANRVRLIRKLADLKIAINLLKP